MRLAALLLALIAATHYGYPILASHYANPEEASRVWFYVLRGLEGTALFVLVGLLARRSLVWLVCIWGAVEEGQTAACQLAIGIETAPTHALFEGICGHGYYAVGLAAIAILAVKILDKGGQNGMAR